MKGTPDGQTNRPGTGDRRAHPDERDLAEARPVDVFFPGAPLEDSEELIEVPGARLAQIDPHAIVPNPRQPRTHFDADDLAELVHSVREFGVLAAGRRPRRR